MQRQAGMFEAMWVGVNFLIVRSIVPNIINHTGLLPQWVGGKLTVSLFTVYHFAGPLFTMSALKPFAL